MQIQSGDSLPRGRWRTDLTLIGLGCEQRSRRRPKRFLYLYFPC